MQDESADDLLWEQHHRAENSITLKWAVVLQCVTEGTYQKGND